MNSADLARFNAALASNQAANFAWWNEEHNYLIDRRAAIPVRRATLELGARLADAGRSRTRRTCSTCSSRSCSR